MEEELLLGAKAAAELTSIERATLDENFMIC